MYGSPTFRPLSSIMGLVAITWIVLINFDSYDTLHLTHASSDIIVSMLMAWRLLGARASSIIIMMWSGLCVSGIPRVMLSMASNILCRYMCNKNNVPSDLEIIPRVEAGWTGLCSQYCKSCLYWYMPIASEISFKGRVTSCIKSIHVLWDIKRCSKWWRHKTGIS